MSPCLRIHYNIINEMFTVNGLKLVPLLFTKQKIKQKHFCKTRLKLFSCYSDVLLRVHCGLQEVFETSLAGQLWPTVQNQKFSVSNLRNCQKVY